tara:strand:- start:523 stop:1008 length:486 start_codon:yes stop_codon:yes gene_type:complete
MTELAVAIAERRDSRHSKTGRFQRFLGDNTTEIGILGEQYFAEQFNVCADLSFKPRGDGGKDFSLPLLVKGEIENIAIDVKTSTIGSSLLVEQGLVKKKCIYVLVHCNKDTKKCGIVGWTWGAVLLAKEPRKWPRHIVNHVLSRKELRDITEIKTRLIKQC